MSKLQIVKTVVNNVAGYGAGVIVGQVIRKSVVPTNTAEKVCVVTATLAVGMMASDFVAAYTDRKIDEIANWFKSTK